MNINQTLSSRAGSSPSRFRNRRKEAPRRSVLLDCFHQVYKVRKDQVGIGWESISPSCVKISGT